MLKEVLKWVKGGNTPSKEDMRHLPEDCKVYKQYLKILSLDEGGLLVMKAQPRFKGDDPPHRLLIPESEKLRREVYHWSHVHTTAGHFGITATCLRAAQRFFWPNMATYLKRAVNYCDDCISKQQKVNLKQTEHKPRRHGHPNQVLYIDLVGPLPKSEKKNRFILTMQDRFTKFSSAVAIPNKEAGTVANGVLEGYITRYGCPDTIHSDQETELKTLCGEN